jgi:predicted amino acid racemase
MYLERARQLNGTLIRHAVALHQAGAIPPASYLIDTDTVRANAALLATQAADLDLRLFFMSKQIGHNPETVAAIRAGGIDKTVAVDGRSAELLSQQGVPLGNVGHLSQIPRSQLGRLLSERQPEFLTVFNVAQARQAAQIAAGLGTPVQALLKVRPDGPATFPGQEGGFYVDELKDQLPALTSLPGLQVSGVTAYPCTTFDRAASCFRPTAELSSLALAAQLVGDQIGSLPHVNAPGNTAAETLELLAERGCSSAEPGHALTGTGPHHRQGRGAEKPALVYVSEIVQIDDGTATAIGGGLYRRGGLRHALVGTDDSITESVPVNVRLPDAQYIDYYFTLELPPGHHVKVGDTVVAVLRPQVFVGYARTVAMHGLHSGNPALGMIRDSQGLEDQAWRTAAR